MNDRKRVEITCVFCGEDSFLSRVPRYEGFRKVGEILRCAACGHEYADESDLPLRSGAPAIFDDSDRPAPVRVFRADEQGRLCRYCAHYVVNPFTQRCGLHRRIVEATDVCDDFEAREKPET